MLIDATDAAVAAAAVVAAAGVNKPAAGPADAAWYWHDTACSWQNARCRSMPLLLSGCMAGEPDAGCVGAASMPCDVFGHRRLPLG